MVTRAIRVADEVWIATALLHRENPEREDFAVAEIVERAASERVTGDSDLRPGVRVHAVQHCVAGKPANPGRLRMLTETARGRRRLYVAGDTTHASRRTGKSMPRLEDIPPIYHELLSWYEYEFVRGKRTAVPQDPILSLRGLGKRIWADEDPDAYVDRLRRGWE